MPPVITLTTDYGLADAFVGAVKGVLLTRCPDARLVDICHTVPPQSVRAGALRLAAAAPYFPAGTVHLAVVDPGVGGPRRAIAIGAEGHFFVGPDNGLLSLAAPQRTPGWRAVALTNQDFWLPAVSQTFHGRDILAPAAAHLAGGSELEALGEPMTAMVELDLPKLSSRGNLLSAVVVDIDGFGNLITNVHHRNLVRRRVKTVEIGGIEIKELSTCYDPARPFVALFNGEGWLEVAAPCGNAAIRLGVGIDAPVVVKLQPKREW